MVASTTPARLCRFVETLALAITLSASVASAQEPYQPDYAIELFNGPVLAPVNITSMGGAFTSVAEGSGAQLLNPVAVANRYSYNGNEWYDWDWSVDWLGVANSDADLDNNGELDATADSILSVAGSVSLQFGRLGLGFMVYARSYAQCFVAAEETCPTSEQLVLGDVTAAFSAGYAFLDGELLTGVQLLFSGIDVDIGVEEGGTAPTTSDNAGLGLGLLWRPHDLPIRVGVTFQAAAHPELDITPGESIADRLLPTRLTRPWRVALGFSWQLGERPYNLRYSFGDFDIWGDDPQAVPRGYHLLSLDVVLHGPSERAVGFGGWLQQTVERAGERPTVSVHLGYETEFWDDRMRGRLGTYLEPSRFRAGKPRLHGTGGVDIRLFELIWMWRITGGFDVAPRYTNLMLSLGFWH